MKNFAKIIVALLLVVVMCLGLSACGEGKFTLADEFKDTKNSSSTIQGGFIAETEDFYYVINGIGNSSDSNKYGEPQGKGSLVAVKKSDMTKSAVIVPKLFVASDYNAGIYVIDGCVYFATPSTSKELSGKAKNTDLTFASAKLDGSEYTEYVTVSGLSSEYRFVKTDSGVVVVYYDSTNTKLVAYNTASKEEVWSIATDEKAERESLGSYKFFNNGNLEDGIVAYTTKLYIGEVKEGTTRSTEIYNKLYIYKASEGAKLFKNGYEDALKDANYEVKAVVNGKVLYKKTTKFDTTGKTYLGDKLVKDSAVYDATYIQDGDDVYTYDSTNTAIVKNGENKEIVAKASDVSTLLYKIGDYFYYTSTDNKLARVKKGAEFVSYLSENSVSTTWFKPVVTDDMIFYCDNSVGGASNIKYLLNSNTEDAELTENYNFAGQKFLVDSLRSEEDKTAEVDFAIDNLSKYLDKNSRITLGKEDETSTEYQVIKLREAYDELSKESKESIEGCYTTLCKYEKAIELSKICLKLEGSDVELKDNLSNYKAYFDSAKEKFTSLEAEGQDYITSICNLMSGNSYYYYKNAVDKKLFD